jgi:NTE family protein
LALGSGGFRGIAAHTGVLKVLIKNKIPIDYIAGSSAGSLVGGVYAATKDIEQLEKKFLELKPMNYLFWFSDLTLTSGFIKGERAIEFIKGLVGDRDISATKIPYSAVTTNLDTGRTVALKKGNLAEAIRASSAIPLILQPRKFGRRWLVDGGASSPVPVEIVKEMGADFVIAVNMNTKVKNIKKERTDNGTKIPKTLLTSQSISILLYNLAKQECQEANITIAPDVAEYNYFNMKEYLGTDKPIKAGEIAAQKAIKHIKDRIKNWKN